MPRIARLISFISLVAASLTGAVVAVTSLVNGEYEVKHVGIFGGAYILMIFGITLYYHRFVTHNSYSFSFLGRFTIRPLLAWAGAIAWQGPVGWWREVHTTHHLHSDRKGDPHSPHTGEGPWHAHVGWIPKTHMLWDPAIHGGLLERVLSRPWAYFLVGPGSGLLISYLIGGWLGVAWYMAAVFWGTCIMTWSINSICHMAAERSKDTGDHSLNVLWIAHLTGGEALHHGHHRHQKSPGFWQKRWEIAFDPGYWALVVFRVLRLIKPLKA